MWHYRAMAHPKLKTPDAGRMTLEQFLVWEEQQPERYEFSGGEVWMMAGGTEGHDSVRGGVFTELRRQLAGKPCRPHLDVKLVCPTGRSRYPDVAVVCGPRDPKATQLRDPVVVVEVLSPSTEAVDFIVKTADYGSVPSVVAYLLVSQDQARVHMIRRTETGFEPVAMVEGLDQSIELPEIEVTLDLAEIYRDTGVS
jgi:Uma2 family endonuclease